MDGNGNGGELKGSAWGTKYGYASAELTKPSFAIPASRALLPLLGSFLCLPPFHFVAKDITSKPVVLLKVVQQVWG